MHVNIFFFNIEHLSMHNASLKLFLSLNSITNILLTVNKSNKLHGGMGFLYYLL